MPFNPKTYSIADRQGLVEIWNVACEYLDAGVNMGDLTRVLYLPVGPRPEANVLRHDLHRLRAAVRAQKADGYLWDGIIIRVVELENRGWGLKFGTAEARVAAMGKLEFYDAAGTLIAARGKPA